MISHLLLDIEGTTCPVSFVSETLFPYASQNIRQFIEENHQEASTTKILQKAICEYNHDHTWLQSQTSQRQLTNPNKDRASLCDYFLHLISIDKKSTALKDLQGKIWKKGYKNGDITSTMFPETATCLQQWASTKLTLAVYSSGSIEAQKLLYQHTINGDLRPLFDYWFDTHTGPKKDRHSYSQICEIMQVVPSTVLFISDSGEECDAAEQAGVQTLFSKRDGNPDQNPKHHRWINNLQDVAQHLK